MTLYASSDITSVGPASSINGHCKGHVRGKKDVTLVIDCPVHEPILKGNKTSWAEDELEIPMTGAEERQAEKDAREGSAGMAEFAKGMAAAYAQQAKEEREAKAAAKAKASV